MSTKNQLSLHKFPILLSIIHENRLKTSGELDAFLKDKNCILTIRDSNTIKQEIPNYAFLEELKNESADFCNNQLIQTEERDENSPQNAFYVKLNLESNPVRLIYMKNILKLDFNFRNYSNRLNYYYNGMPQNLHENIFPKNYSEMVKVNLKVTSLEIINKIKENNEYFFYRFYNQEANEHPSALSILSNLNDYIFQTNEINDELTNFTIYTQSLIESIILDKEFNELQDQYKNIFLESKLHAFKRELITKLRAKRIFPLLTNQMNSKQLSKELGISPQRLYQLKIKASEDAYKIAYKYLNPEIKKLITLASSKSFSISIDEIKNLPIFDYLLKDNELNEINFLEILVSGYNKNEFNKIKLIQNKSESDKNDRADEAMGGKINLDQAKNDFLHFLKNDATEQDWIEILKKTKKITKHKNCTAEN